MSVIWEVTIAIFGRDGEGRVATNGGYTVKEYDTEEAAQAAYVDAVKQLGGKQ